MPDKPEATATVTTDKPEATLTFDGTKGTEQPDEPLGDAGKRALESERELRKDAEARAKAAERAQREATSDREKAIADAKAEARREILDEANGRLLRAEVKAAAAGKFANPEVAVKLLDLSLFKVADDGSVDTKAITAAIDTLLADEPYLAAKVTAPSGSADGGRKGEPAPSKLDMNSLIRAAAKPGG